MESNINIKSFAGNASGEITDMQLVGSTISIGHDSVLEDNKIVVLPASGGEITPSSGYDAMKKVTVSINEDLPVHEAGMGTDGDEDDSDVSSENAMLFFADADMTTPLDPNTLTGTDEVHAVFLDDTNVYGFGVNASLFGTSSDVNVSLLKLSVDVIDTDFIRFEGDVSGTTTYFVINKPSTPVNMDWLFILTTYRGTT